MNIKIIHRSKHKEVITQANNWNLPIIPRKGEYIDISELLNKKTELLKVVKVAHMLQLTNHTIVITVK